MTDDAERPDTRPAGGAGHPDESGGESEIRDERVLRTTATPQQVWEAWAVPERLRQWFPEDARGEPVPGAQLVHVWTSMGFETVHEVLAAEPGRRLVLAGKIPPSGAPFRQEVVIEREGGETVMRLVNSGFEPGADWDEDVFAGVDSGWKLALAILKHYLEHHFGEDRRSFNLFRPAAFEQEALQRLFREPAGLARWLTRSGSLAGLSVGDPVRLELADGPPLTGRLLADSGRELAVTWTEVRGVFMLKGFKMPGLQAVGVAGSSWGDGAAEGEDLAGRFGAAVERLVAALAAG